MAKKKDLADFMRNPTLNKLQKQSEQENCVSTLRCVSFQCKIWISLLKSMLMSMKHSSSQVHNFWGISMHPLYKSTSLFLIQWLLLSHFKGMCMCFYIHITVCCFCISWMDKGLLTWVTFLWVLHPLSLQESFQYSLELRPALRIQGLHSQQNKIFLH